MQQSKFHQASNLCRHLQSYNSSVNLLAPTLHKVGWLVVVAIQTIGDHHAVPTSTTLANLVVTQDDWFLEPKVNDSCCRCADSVYTTK